MKTENKKTVIITGATSGIGKALAEEFGKHDFNVVITGRNLERLQTTAQELTQKGITVLPVQADVAIETDNQKVVEKTLQQFGKIDVLINNAGISMRALFSEVETSVIRQLMEINFFGTVYATKYCLPYILQQKGSILAISSIAGYRGLPARSGYSASKFAMQGFMESLRTELLHTGVKVLVVCPGFTSSNIRNTALNAKGNAQQENPLDESKLMSADEVAKATFKAYQQQKRTLILTTQGKMTVWLNKLFPAFMDKMVFNYFKKEKQN